MEFFTKAKDAGWLCDKIVTEKFPVSDALYSTEDYQLTVPMPQPMFPEDPGEEEVRATVHGWRLTRA